MWTETAAMLRDRPLSGAGLSGYPTVIAPYHKDPKVEIFQYPHNIVLNFWSETGLLGLLAFGWIVFEFFRLARRRGDASLEIPLAAAMTAASIARVEELDRLSPATRPKAKHSVRLPPPPG